MEYSCRDCQYCRYTHIGKTGNAKYKSYYCCYPDMSSVVKYFAKHNLRKKFGYVGKSYLYTNQPDVEGKPRWCPLARKEGKNE